jgi:alanyl-tRNA synthetase
MPGSTQPRIFMLSSRDIRRQYIEFFVRKHGHTFVPSSPVVPHDDPTLLFTNAGMNQFKPLFLGTDRRDYTRAVNTQKCIRAGGKHNDLDDVGRSRRHHTFFEMLGNWSFGDYFKREAIAWAWELLTEVWKLDPARLHVTCFEGDEKNGVPRDTEAAELWKEVAGLPDDHIHYFGKDNFWEMGDTGPCGPCTEIYVDRTPDKSGRDQVNGDDPRVMEIWNLVFIQYNRNADRSLTPLPSKHVDTGMGFERIAQVLQDKDNNYAIDLWDPFWQKLTDLSGRRYANRFPRTNAADPQAEAADAQLRTDIAFRVIGDHVRCLTFALTDGAVPSNEGRGYVLRRILRRAVRFGRQTLELREPFLHKLVDVVVESMGDAFPELRAGPARVAEIIRDEELSFGRTLDRGIDLVDEAGMYAIARALPGKKRWIFGSRSTFDEGLPYEQWELSREARMRLIQRLDDGSHREIEISRDPQAQAELIRRECPQAPVIDAGTAFKLHDTFGFPIDLTQQMAVERGLSVDVAGYERLMEEAREKARAAGKGGDSPVYDLPPAILDALARQGVRRTDDSPKFALEPVRAKVLATWNGSNLDTRTGTSEDQEIAVLLDRTPFYAEMGGQVGDAGTLKSDQATFDVATTRNVGGYVLHIGRVNAGTIAVGDSVVATVSPQRRATMQNHTGTHLANWALREVLGDSVQQKGSLVDPHKLRFDFSHDKAMPVEDVTRVEQLVRQGIEQSLPVHAEEAPQAEAMQIHGLRAVFGEKYPPRVRVVSIGRPVGELLKNPADPTWRQYSIEFCGGTHLSNTRDIGGFVVTSEESVSKGIRRIVALTGDAARASQQAAKQIEDAVSQATSAPESQLPQITQSLQRELSRDDLPLVSRRRAQQAIAELQDKHRKWLKTQQATAAIDVSAISQDLLGRAVELGGGKVIVAGIESVSDEQLRSLIDSLKKRQPSLGVLLAGTDGGKISFVAAVSDDLIARGLKAGDWIRDTAKAAGGGGGGRPQMAQAGGKDVTKLGEALEVAKAFAAKALA